VAVAISEPGMDNRAAPTSANEMIKIGEFFERFFNNNASLNDTWPRFRGEDFDNVKKSGKALIDQFGNDPKNPMDSRFG
jgi:outer membrane protein assembly factor BamB